MRHVALQADYPIQTAQPSTARRVAQLGQAAAKPSVHDNPQRAQASFRRVLATLAPLPKRGGQRSITRTSTRPASTILLAEDDYLVRTVVGSGLSLYGYAVLAASDGEEAITLLYRHAREISLALIDLGMPKRPGHEVVELIQALGLDIPVIVTSGFEPKDVSPIPGLTAYLKKPFEIPDLIEQVRAVLPQE